MRLARNFTVLLLCLQLSPPAPLGARQDADAMAQRGDFSATTTVVVVEVPVNVVRDGQPVRGLTAEDFVVLDRGEPRPLAGFEVVDLEAVATGGDRRALRQAVPEVAQRHFLLLFDLAFSRANTLRRSIEGGRELLAELHPTDRVAVAVFGVSGGARLLLSFTSDRRQVGRVLDTLESLLSRHHPKTEKRGKGRPETSDPLRLTAGDASSMAAEIGRAAGSQMSLAGQILSESGSAGGGGRAGDLRAETLADMDELETKQISERRRGEAAALAEAFTGIAEVTRGILGRKYLVYFSEGFGSDLLEGRGAAAFLKRLNAMFTELREGGWAIQSVDSGGVRGLTDEGGKTGSLLLLARETGGDLHQNFNDLGTAMENLLDRTGVTYLLAFQSPEIALDGSFHPIEVRLRDGARGAELRHRAGYYAPNPGEEPSATARTLSAAEMVLAGEEGGELDVAALVTPLRNPQGDGSDVSVWVEVRGDGLLKDFAAEPLGTELYVYALDAEDEVHDFFTRTIQLDPARIESRLARGGDLKFYGDLHLGPGEYELRILVRSGKVGRYGLRSVPLTVGDRSRSGPVLLEPVLIDDPQRPSIVVRETEETTESGNGSASYPFRIGDVNYFPAVHRSFAAGRPARISVMAYALEKGLSLEYRVMRGDGSFVEDDRLAVVAQDTQGDLRQFFFAFRSAGLEPGEYTFLVSLLDPGGAAPCSASMTFRLTE